MDPRQFAANPGMFVSLPAISKPYPQSGPIPVSLGVPSFAYAQSQKTQIPFDTLQTAKVKTTTGGFGRCKLGNHTVPTKVLHSLGESLKCAACGFCLRGKDQCPMCSQGCREIVEEVGRLAER